MEAFRHNIRNRAVYYHAKAAGMRKLPLPALTIIAGLAVTNAVTWAGVGIVLVMGANLLPRVWLILVSALP